MERDRAFWGQRAELGLALSLVFCAGPGAGCERRAAPGAIQIVSYPRADVLVDGAPIGLRTPVQRHRMAAGRHVVTLGGAGVRFESQSVVVRPGETSHLYFRAHDASASIASDALCTTGAEDLCWERIGAAMQAGRRSEARTLGEVYLRAHPDGGYALVVRDLVGRLGGDARAHVEADPE